MLLFCQLIIAEGANSYCDFGGAKVSVLSAWFRIAVYDIKTIKLYNENEF
jgi:hypothetical protein